MLAKLALAIFLMVNGALTGPFGVAVVDKPFPTVQACEEFAKSDEGLKMAAQVEKYAKGELGDTAVVVPTCVPLDEPTKPKADERGAALEGDGGITS